MIYHGICAADILVGDCLQSMQSITDKTINTCVTSPPYFGLRDYGHSEQIGLESNPDEFVEALVKVFREVRRVLRDDGTLWLNLGDSYNNFRSAMGPAQTVHNGELRGKVQPDKRARGVDGLKEKDLIGIPWRVAFALQADGWYLRQDIIWHKPNPMPESVRDRCTKAHEYVFLLSKSERYYFDAEAIAEPLGSASISRLSQPGLAEQHGSDRVPGKTNGAMRAVGGPRRPQALRAVEIARDAGLTQAHIDAIRAVGITDAGKARVTQTGTGRNDPAIQALADQAKAALGGYYREFLIAEKRNKRSVWTVTTRGFPGAHFATFPPDLIEPAVLAGCPINGIVLDPFGGSGTTAGVALKNGRNAILCELNPEYAALAPQRVASILKRAA